MNLVLCNPSLAHMGGAERVILEIAEKFNPIIYTACYEPEKTFQEFRQFYVRVIKQQIVETALHALRENQRLHISAYSGLRFLNFTIKDDYDAISAHVIPSEWIRNKNERVCWYCHGVVRPGIYQSSGNESIFPRKQLLQAAKSAYMRVERHIVPKIEKICTNSLTSKGEIQKYLNRKDVSVIYPAVDAKRFECESYGKFFLYPSRLVPEKRMEFAIEAFKKFGKKNWKLMIAGHHSGSKRDQKYLEHLAQISSGFNVDIRLNPSETALKKLYSTCYATLFSSSMEHWGIVPLESMASCKPCISVNEGGPTESIIDGQTGYLVNSPEEMAQKMQFLADHPNETERMGKLGRKRVQQHYTWEKFLGKMEKVFKETAKM